MKNKLRVAIDGPAAAGKSTVAKQIVDQLNIVYVDTGAMYRAFTLKALQEKMDLSDQRALSRLLQQTKIELKHADSGQSILLDGVDVTTEIRNTDVTNHVSLVAQYQDIREKMVEQQRELADDVDVVMDGRDIGTHVIPDAEVKIYLIASAKERAIRRHRENKEKGIVSNLETLEEEIIKRDHHDMNRASSPLIQAKDAILIDTTSMTTQQVVTKIMNFIPI